MDKEIGLFIDYEGEPIWDPDIISGWRCCKDYDDVFNSIGEYVGEHSCFPKLICINHDLTEELKTWSEENRGVQYPYSEFSGKSGIHVAMLLGEYAKKRGVDFNSLVCSSCANPIGAKNLQKCVNTYKKLQGLPESCFTLKIEVNKYKNV